MTTEPGVAEAKPTNIFIGSKGLRAGWGILLFIAVFSALGFGTWFVMHSMKIQMPHDGGQMAPNSVIFGEGLQAAMLVLATLITAAIERRPLGQLGLGGTNAVPRFLQGLVVGFLMLSGLIGLLYVTHAIVIDKIAPLNQETLTYGGLWFIAFLLVGITEEFMFRTYLQQTIGRGINYIVAAVIMGGLFMFAHTGNHGETPIGLGLVFAAGLLFTVSVWRTGTIWWAVGFHAAWDWAQSYFYGTPDSGLTNIGTLMTSHPQGAEWLSGGTTGPEGSVLAIAAMLLSAVVIWVMAPKQDVKLDMKLWF